MFKFEFSGGSDIRDFGKIERLGGGPWADLRGLEELEDNFLSFDASIGDFWFQFDEDLVRVFGVDVHHLLRIGFAPRAERLLRGQFIISPFTNLISILCW